MKNGFLSCLFTLAASSVFSVFSGPSHAASVNWTSGTPELGSNDNTILEAVTVTLTGPSTLTSVSYHANELGGIYLQQTFVVSNLGFTGPGTDIDIEGAAFDDAGSGNPSGTYNVWAEADGTTTGGGGWSASTGAGDYVTVP